MDHKKLTLKTATTAVDHIRNCRCRCGALSPVLSCPPGSALPAYLYLAPPARKGPRVTHAIQSASQSFPFFLSLPLILCFQPHPPQSDMPTTTRAYVARPSAGIALETIHLSSPAAHEILVETVAFSMCHTDVRAAAGGFYLKPPVVLGHEAAGYVREVGPGVSAVGVGDAVVLSYAHCGVCMRCLSGRAAYCDELPALNFTGERIGGGGKVVRDDKGEGIKGFFFGQSSMGRMVLAHESCAVKVHASCREELKLFASLGCGIQTGAGAVFNVLKPAADATIAVFRGGGGVGGDSGGETVLSEGTGPGG